jgi:hypothetical protein
VGEHASVPSGAALDPLLLTGRGITLGSISVRSRADFEAMNRAIAMHCLHPVIDRTFPFAKAKEAYRHFEGGGYFGKVVISASDVMRFFVCPRDQHQIRSQCERRFRTLPYKTSLFSPIRRLHPSGNNLYKDAPRKVVYYLKIFLQWLRRWRVLEDFRQGRATTILF